MSIRPCRSLRCRIFYLVGTKKSDHIIPTDVSLIAATSSGISTGAMYMLLTQLSSSVLGEKF